jgi:hypothetical protein
MVQTLTRGSALLRRWENLNMTSPLGTRNKNTLRQQELIARRKALAKSNKRRQIMISTFGLLVTSAVVVGAVVAIMSFASKPTSSTLADQSLTSSGDSQGMSGDMPGMDMGPGSRDVPPASATPTPTPTSDPGSGDMPGMSGDMPGMDMYPGPTDIPATKPTPDPHSSDMPGMSGDMPGMSGGDGHSDTVAIDRPLAPVLGTFGGGTSAVMLTAVFLRRKDRAANAAKQASRAARKAQS